MIEKAYPNNYKIVYTDPSTGLLAIIHPTGDSSLEYIAESSVPKGVPFWVVDPETIPTDRTFRDAWELDKTLMGNPDGYGGEDD